MARIAPFRALVLGAALLGLAAAGGCQPQEGANAKKDGAEAGNSVMAGVDTNAPAGAAADLASLTPQQQAAVRALIRDTLVANPEILLEAQRAFEAKQNREMNERVAGAFDTMKREEAQLAFGPANAPITVIEFFDYKCGFCHAAQPWVVSLLNDRKDVRVIFKELPILSENSAQAAKAAHRQGKYLAFHNALMNARGDLNVDQVNQIAASVGIDVERMRKDMDDPKIEESINRVRQQATDLGINGTPAFVVNGKLVSGFAKDELEAALGAAGVDASAAKKG
jgi:protein-disulfide isomerase